MTKIQDILFYRVFKPYGKVITMIFLAVMLIVISKFVYYKYVLPIMDKTKMVILQTQMFVIQILIYGSSV